MSFVNLEEVRTRIEQERFWREAELRFLKNQLGSIEGESSKNTYRKSLVVMLYAHFEGACKAFLMIYVDGLNRSSLLVEEASPAIAAATLDDVFRELRNPNKKCQIFNKDLPEEGKLHRFARDRDFVEALPSLVSRNVTIKAEQVVDTESNLKPVVLRKMLYRLGLDPDMARPWAGTINELLNRRNSIAHGMGHEGVDENTYDRLERNVYQVIEQLVDAISEAIQNEIYLRQET